MHHACGVSHCDLATQDVICPSHRDQLVTALTSIATGGVHRVRHHKDWDNTLRTYTTREEVDYLPGLWEDLQVTVTRQDRIGAAEARVSGEGETPEPFNTRASKVATDVQSAVTHAGAAFAIENPHLHTRPTSVAAVCAWLAGFPSLLAGHSDAPTMLATFTSLVRHIEHVIDRAPDRVYLGICSAPTTDFPCDQDVFGIEGRDIATCRACGHQHDIAARQAALLDAIRRQDATPTEIARSFAGYAGLKLNASSIRTWARLGELKPTGHTEDDRPKYNVGAVFDLAQSKATRTRKEAA